MTILPDVAPPVSKLTPVQEVPSEDQLKVTESPVAIELELGVIVVAEHDGVLHA